MKLRFLVVLGWIALGHVAIGGLYWALLQVPESNVFMLALSVIVALLLILSAAIVEIGGLSLWTGSIRDALARAVRRAAWIAPAAVLFLVVWQVLSTIHGSYQSHATELDAWLLLKAGWTRTAWIHRTVAWVFWFLSYGVGLSLALSLLARTCSEGPQALARLAWLRQGLWWRQVLVITVAVLIGMVLPWQYVYWRPRRLPASWVEPAFLAAKLFVLYLTASLAWTIVLRTVGKRAASA